ncbi:hypothetical protein CDAR_13201 [Caerostris darwini]|uniref:Uncharacterized protein n=1 Tax=Caerostris darwini TaxID=1538125 RepID=A0AAV4R1H6_9ARAC|nr:hypothetical protein CDAR_13201 [Caerostris darwini]
MTGEAFRGRFSLPRAPNPNKRRDDRPFQKQFKHPRLTQDAFKDFLCPSLIVFIALTLKKKEDPEAYAKDSISRKGRLKVLFE